jgi:hypothetical protein
MFVQAPNSQCAVIDAACGQPIRLVLSAAWARTRASCDGTRTSEGCPRLCARHRPESLHRRLAAETDAAYPIAVSLAADIDRALEALTSALVSDPRPARPFEAKIRALRDAELDEVDQECLQRLAEPAIMTAS